MLRSFYGPLTRYEDLVLLVYGQKENGPVPSKDKQTPSSPLRSGHLDIKDTQCAETEDVLKKSYHIISRH